MQNFGQFVYLHFNITIYFNTFCLLLILNYFYCFHCNNIEYKSWRIFLILTVLCTVLFWHTIWPANIILRRKPSIIISVEWCRWMKAIKMPTCKKVNMTVKRNFAIPGRLLHSFLKNKRILNYLSNSLV